MVSSTRVLVVAAHPDDEILGVGGTIRRHVLSDHSVHSVVVCESETIRYADRKVPMERFGLQAAKVLGNTIEYLRYPDQRLEDIPLTELIIAIEKQIKKHQPHIIYTHFGGDLNLDHKRLFDAVLVAVRPTTVSKTICTILAFETASSTEWAYPQSFSPDTFIDISETLDTKIEAIMCYKSELHDWPHPRSVEGLIHRAKYFGSIAGMDSAEPFVTVRNYRRINRGIW